jgi:Holliday junction resolvase RusA-like endonuclease
LGKLVRKCDIPDDLLMRGTRDFGECGFWVPGIPRPKGSMDILPKAGAKGVATKGGIHYRIRDLWLSPRRSTREKKKVDLLGPWVNAVQWASLDHKPRLCLNGPFTVGGTFYFPRPDSPRHPTRVLETKYGDADKLIRAIGDALEGIYWVNDGQLEWGEVKRRWTDKDHREPGAAIWIRYYGVQAELF